MKKFMILTILFVMYSSLISYPKEIDISYSNQPKAPCLIICPGSGYHKDLPLIAGLYDLAKQNNITVCRFNWRYFSNKSKPSAGYKDEIEDINQIIDHLKKRPEIDSTQIYLAGKSLGSVLAYRVFNSRTDLKGLILLTPLFPDYDTALSYYSDILKMNKPCFIAVGANDKDNCDIKALYKLAASMTNDLRLYVTGGDHGFNLDTENYQSKENTDNIDLVNKTTIEWLRQNAGIK